MNWINNLKIMQRLVLLVTLLLIGVICVGFTGFYFLNKTNTAMDKMYSEKLAAVELTYDNRTHGRKIEADISELIRTKNISEQDKLYNDINARSQTISDNLKKFEQLPMTKEEKTKLNNVYTPLENYRNTREIITSLAKQNKHDEASTIFDQKGKALSEDFSHTLSALATSTINSAKEMNEQNKHDFAIANTLFVSITLATIIIGILLGLFITRQIKFRLDNFVNYITFLADGDFSKDIPKSSLQDKSEFGIVSQALDTMRANIKKLVTHSSLLSDHLASASEELTASADQSAQAANQIATSVTEVANSAGSQLQLAGNADNLTQQISGAIDQVALNIQTVSGAAEKTANTANNGEDAINHAVTQMKTIEEKTNSTADVIGDLEEKSKQIGQIVDVISNISGQTNLLALNAAIEAARAGEAGKGFAVVAEEVRKLAEQSQDAAKKITELIEQVQAKTDNAVSFMDASKKEVETGAAVISNAGESFKEILHMIRSITDQIRDISAAIEEVTGHTLNVVDAVQKIDTESKKSSEETQTISAATEEQSASVEEIASASRHLAEMAEELQHAIKEFRI
ncbi:HAMP domain-containing methyl-accepting chemotaxis protein [Pectinatus sottacetonis]|uniref:HAMP domain-containing methyl-accepting chemotaxis protein n=1 Tax=Pectinatus sottacetonis TaxID=1002795 RepID=UPI0018C54B37|nr:methyl-accepting chemotaxis protein [Pectinatus sottacetonis]